MTEQEPDTTADEAKPTFSDGIEHAARLAALYETGEQASAALFVAAKMTADIEAEVAASEADRATAGEREAAAWDRGWRAGYAYRGPHGEGAGHPMPDNPYREK